MELEGTVEVGGAEGCYLPLDGAEAHTSCSLIPEDAASGRVRGRRDHPALIAKKGDGGRWRDLDVVGLWEETGPFAPEVHFGVAMDQSPGGEEGRSGLVALDVHADQTVGVKGSAGQFFDFGGRGGDVCFVPEFWERL
jgi:hypothetical protein